MDFKKESVKVSCRILKYSIYILVQVHVNVLKRIVDVLAKEHVLLNLVSAVQLQNASRKSSIVRSLNSSLIGNVKYCVSFKDPLFESSCCEV